MPKLAPYPIDTAICRLLAGGPLPTAAISDRLAIPDRTVRHRLSRLRQAGVVVTDPDKLHHLAAEPLPDLADPAPGLADLVPALAAEPLPDLADPAPGLAAATASDQPSPSHGGHWSPGTVLVATVLGLAVAGVVVVAVGIRHMPTPPAPSPSPTRFGNAAGLPGGLGWSPW